MRAAAVDGSAPAHARARVRAAPLVDIAPAVTIPGRGLARRELRAVRDQRIARTRSHRSTDPPPAPQDHRARPWISTKCRYIVVEGPIGAGKTSLARQLAMHLDADMLLEQPEDNPFLSRFYDDMPRFALPTQLTFLFQRADQLRGLSQLDMFRRPTVADFLLDKDPLFARLNLSDDEYACMKRSTGT